MIEKLNELLEEYRTAIYEKSIFMNNPCTAGNTYDVAEEYEERIGEKKQAIVDFVIKHSNIKVKEKETVGLGELSYPDSLISDLAFNEVSKY
jgi:hypothetical protein